MAANDTRRAPGRVARLFPYIALVAATAVTWALSRPPSEVERTRRQFGELQRQVDAARESRSTRATDRGRVMRLRAQARGAQAADRLALETEAAAIESRLGWGDPPIVRGAVLSTPLLTFRRTTAPSGVAPVYSAAASGCVACHVAIATPGFEKHPAPFRTHPNLLAYVGAQSPHPPSRVGCASCHEGDGDATTFVSAGHSTLDSEVRAAPSSARVWADVNASAAMLPVGRTEAGCITCHAGEVYQPGAFALNAAFVTLERGGCYACHDVPGPRTRKRGPDLRRIKSKLSPEWVRYWLADPRAVKPATWMPGFWTASQASTSEVRAEIDAVVAYLFANSDNYLPAIASPPAGDATRGQRLVESVGCFGCHVTGDAARDAASVRRTFGQPLEAVGSKTTYAWLFDWLREPSRYSPDTLMPSLRLSDAEAADIASYLRTLTSMPPPGESHVEDDAAYRSAIERYAGQSAASAQNSQLTGDALRVAAGSTIIEARGCFNCHQIRGFEGKATRVPIASRRVWRDEDVAATHARRSEPGRAAPLSAPPSTPDYSFGVGESARLGLALTATAAGRATATHTISMPWHVTRVAGRALAQGRNCVGCHEMEGIGGDFVKLVAEPSLGPPPLTPEGSRVQPDWLRQFLHEPRVIRPWLSVRMPSFALGDEDLQAVRAYFLAIAPPNPAAGADQPEVSAAAGKQLFDLLKCQQCHVLGTIPSDQPTSNLAPDLRLSRQRLQPEWILAWLQNPSAVLPGTRMPSFWPDYPKSFYEPLNRDGALQVRAIRDHLLTLR